MADDAPIIVEVTDKVDPAIQAKIEGIATASRDASDAIKDLQKQLGLLKSNPVNDLQKSVDGLTSSLRSQIQTQQSAVQQMNTSSAAHQAAVAATQSLTAAVTQNNAAKSAVSTSTIAAAAAENKLLNSIQGTAETYGKSKSEQLAYKAAQAGLTAEAAPFIQKLKESEAALESVGHGSTGAYRELLVLGHELATGNTSRFGGSLMVLAERTNAWTLLFNPLTLGILATGAAMVGLIAAGAAWDTQQSAVNATMQGAGRILGLTTDQFIAMAQASAVAGNISTKQALTLGEALAKTGQLGADNIGAIIALSKNFAKTIGTDFAGAQQVLVKTFSDPEKGVEALNNQLHFLDAASLKNIQNMVAQGNAQGAIKLALDRLPAALANAETGTGKLAKAWESVSTFASNAFLNIGRAIDKAAGGGTLDDRIKGAQDTVSALQNRINTRNRVPLRDGTSAALQLAQKQLSDLQSQKADLEKQTQSKADDANLNKQSVDIRSVVTQAAPAAEALQKLKDALTLVNQAANNDALKQKVGDTQSLTTATASLSEAVDSFITPAQKQQAINALDIQLINARTASERAAISSARTRLDLAGQVIDPLQKQNAINQAGLVITTQAAKERADENLQMDRTIQLYGMIGPERANATEALNKELAARRAGNAYSPSELEALKGKIALNQQLADVQSQLDKIYNDTLKPAKDLNDTITAANQLLSQGKISWQQYSSAIVDAKIKALDAENTMSAGFKSGLLAIQKEANSVGQTMKDGVVSVFHDGEDAVVNFAKTGKFNVSDFATSVLGDLTRVAYRLIVVRTLMNSFGGLFGMPTASLGSAGNSMTGAAGDPTGGGAVLTPAAGGTDGIVPGNYHGRDTMLQPVAPGERVTVQTPAQQANSGDGSGHTTNVIVNEAPPGTTVQHTQSGSGVDTYAVIIGTVQSGFAKGEFDDVNKARYNAAPIKRRR